MKENVQERAGPRERLSKRDFPREGLSMREIVRETCCPRERVFFQNLLRQYFFGLTVYFTLGGGGDMG